MANEYDKPSKQFQLFAGIMSRTNSAPGSPIIGSQRTNSPRMNRSFRVGSEQSHQVIRAHYHIDVLF